MAGLFAHGDRVKLDVEIYSDDVVGVEMSRDLIDVTSFASGPQYVSGLPRSHVELSGEAHLRIAQALIRALREHGPAAPVRPEVQSDLRRAISFGLE